VCGWIYGCIFFCVVVIQKSSKDNFSWDVFAAQYSPILNCKIQEFFLLNKQKSRSRERVLGTCLLDHHGWEFYGDHNACDHASVHGTAMWGSHCCCIRTSSCSSQPHALRGWEEEHPTWSGMEWDKECPKWILYLIHHVMMMMMMRQFCLRDCVYLAFRSRCYAYRWVQINTYILVRSWWSWWGGLSSWHHHFTALCDEGDDHDDALMLNLLFQNGHQQVYCWIAAESGCYVPLSLSLSLSLSCQQSCFIGSIFFCNCLH
jgi:hypothetical protein